MKIKKPRLLIHSLALPYFAGFLGSIFTNPAIPTWYAGLNKPFFSPPNWLSGPVWLILYTLMGISVYLVWLKAGRSKNARHGVFMFFIHLFFNAIWPIIFFGFQDLALAFMVILIIDAFIVYLILAFWRINKLASYLLVPYLLWATFASILNYLIYLLN